MRKMNSVSSSRVRITGGMLGERARINREKILHSQYQKLAESGRLNMVRRAAGEDIDVQGHIFWDSDIAKWLEGVGCSLGTHPDPDLEQKADALIDLYERAQAADGYLNTYYSSFAPDARWTNLRDCHELYCAGHLMEAAVAYYNSTGKRKLLDVMCRMADHIDSKFGPEPGKMRGYPGHEEIELALVRLYRATGNKRYLDLAKFFIDERGTEPSFFIEEARKRGARMSSRRLPSMQAHKPVREQKEAVGHAVRAVYLYTGMADVGAETGDKKLLAVCRTLWENITRRKMYVTGGVGARHADEAFGANYELPNVRAYAETCAAIGLVFFARRMLEIKGNAEYADILELALFNGALAGLSLDGENYFYVNPLAYDGSTPFNRGAGGRKPWFDCSCCPTNLARFLPALGEYLYSINENSVYVHLYAPSEANLEIGSTGLNISQATDYPWDGKVTLTVHSETPVRAAVRLRIPGWCPQYDLMVNGATVEVGIEDGYLVLERNWDGEDKIELDLEMPIKQVVSDPRVEADRGCVALQRGPIVYCAEQIDHDAPVSSLAIPEDAELTHSYRPDLLGGCCVIEGVVGVGAGTDDTRLYETDIPQKLKSTKLQAIPYPLWANRGNHSMSVWMLRCSG